MVLAVSCSQKPITFIFTNSIEIADGTKFIVIGDWGRRGSPQQQEVASAMAYVSRSFPIEFIISTGDNFYNKGVTDIHDNHWQESFERVYSDTSLHVPWYISLGNHDHYGNVTAQINYSNISDRWIMPSPYYSTSIQINDSSQIHLIITDTQVLKNENGDVEEQYIWLEETLGDSEAQWTFVIGHHPLRTGGKHGENQNLVYNLKPILDRNDVDVYFAGHDHDLQLLKEANTHFVVSGAGSKTRKVKNTSYSLFSSSELGFVLGSITKDELHLYFINEKAQLLYAYTITK